MEMVKAFLASFLVLGMVSSAGASDLIACADIEAEAQQIPPSADNAVWASFYDKAFNDSDCEGDVVDRIGQMIIKYQLPALEAEFANHTDGADYDGLLAALDEMITFGSHWRVPFLMGEIYRQKGQVSHAYASYREALSILDDEEITPNIPPRDAIATLRARLDETGLVFAQMTNDPNAVKPLVTRSGKPGSEMTFSTRGYKRKKTLVPLQFVFAKADLTEVGEATFTTIFEALKRQGSPDILIVGHTDPVGSDKNNLALSLLRAGAVRQKLKTAGYEGKVDIDGKGESQPFLFDDPGLYSEKQRHQAHRRVELILR